ncbi:MAG TPA: bacteriohopanetetrol glucosamine biosynthesis glycosyltransferase HpnI [Bryobacteraceae bacterium]
MIWRFLFAVPALVAGCYYLLALAAALRRKVRPQAEVAGSYPGVSILKPIYGWDDRLPAAIASHARQHYPQFELLLGVRVDDTRALAEIRRSQQAFPGCAIRIVNVTTAMPNGKAGSLHDLAAAAFYPVLVINDADICVEPDYLRQVTEPLRDSRVGLVTALYRATAASLPARFEALGVTTEFAPSVLVARLFGVAEFALGSTMAVRAEDLGRIGGFRAIGDYLADDYQLGAQITRLGLHVAFADTVVETTLGAGSWGEVWKHQLRWSRTIRVSRPSGYYGYGVTQATFWACVAAAAGYGSIALGVLAVRLAAGMAAAVVLKDRAALARWWMIPFRDVFGFAVWVTAAFGKTVEWRGLRLRLTPDGRIHPVESHAPLDN